MSKPSGNRRAFVVQILDRQNATWQGTVTRASERKTESFRSALELIRLIDSALKEESPPADTP